MQKYEHTHDIASFTVCVACALEQGERQRMVAETQEQARRDGRRESEVRLVSSVVSLHRH